jgi:hypothetical protein
MSYSPIFSIGREATRRKGREDEAHANSSAQEKPLWWRAPDPSNDFIAGHCARAAVSR